MRPRRTHLRRARDDSRETGFSQVHSYIALHKEKLTLPLFVAWILTDNTDHAAALDNAAFAAHFLHGCSNLHVDSRPPTADLFYLDPAKKAIHGLFTSRDN